MTFQSHTTIDSTNVPLKLIFIDFWSPYSF